MNNIIFKTLPFLPQAINASSIAWLITCFSIGLHAAPPEITFDNGKLSIKSNERGDTLSDFSYCGYLNNQTPIPQIQTRYELKPTGGDDTELIQRALDELASAPLDKSGWRGALALSADTFCVSGTIRVRGDHLLLRGSSTSDRTTTIVATGHGRRPLIQVGGLPGKLSSRTSELDELLKEAERESSNIEGYVPLGSRSLKLTSAKKFAVGQNVIVQHPSTARWIAALKMNSMPTDDPRGSWLDWKPGAYDQLWLRKITKIDGEQIELDVPLTYALDPDLTEARVVSATGIDQNWASHVGVENLRLISWAESANNPKDEEHAWDGIKLNQVQNAWVRGITAQQFVGSAILIGRNSRAVSVSDCNAVQPISEDAQWRRQTYLTYGQQTLFLRCSATAGRHDFAVGFLTAGPNAFSYCRADGANHDSGPLGSWSTGVLYDNVTLDGAALALTNREAKLQGTGWSSANSILWNCVAPLIECRAPPTATNWAVGVWGEFNGDGYWRAMNEFVSPDSLLHSQLSQRVGRQTADMVLTKVETPAPATIDCTALKLPEVKQETTNQLSPADTQHRLSIQNGWFTLGDRLAIGSRQTQAWWRGAVLPAKVGEFGPGLLRYVPGLDHRFYTDSVTDIADQMQANQRLVLEQHWGLWYDRRRDDHQMVRRASADVWAPFYEQPWARSGQGQAWDGLSKYDLTRFNPWYFDRLEEFASQADQRGLVLMYSMYFQHNILEAGAHWADFPWRPANCLQSTGFPEPPVHQNRKRIFMADDFYDVSHPVRRELHTLYIRHCLDRLSRHSNVVFALGEEFTGPEHFARFWLETVEQWQRENKRDVMVMLSATRDVQEALLADPATRAMVDAIDIKYWWLTRDGHFYDPPGGQNLAPRQQLREWKGSKNSSPESLAKAIYEVRHRFHDKAVVCSVSGADPWLTLAAGGSFVALPPESDHRLLEALVSSRPIANEATANSTSFALRNEAGLLIEVKKSNAPSAGQVELDRKTGKPVLSKGSPDSSSSEYRIFWKMP